MNLGELKLRASPWIALVVGLILLSWAMAEHGAAVSLADLVPGLGVLAAGLILFGWLGFLDRPIPDGDSSDPGDELSAP